MEETEKELRELILEIAGENRYGRKLRIRKDAILVLKEYEGKYTLNKIIDDAVTITRDHGNTFLKRYVECAINRLENPPELLFDEIRRHNALIDEYKDVFGLETILQESREVAAEHGCYVGTEGSVFAGFRNAEVCVYSEHVEEAVKRLYRKAANSIEEAEIVEAV